MPVREPLAVAEEGMPSASWFLRSLRPAAGVSGRGSHRSAVACSGGFAAHRPADVGVLVLLPDLAVGVGDDVARPKAVHGEKLRGSRATRAGGAGVLKGVKVGFTGRFCGLT